MVAGARRLGCLGSRSREVWTSSAFALEICSRCHACPAGDAWRIRSLGRSGWQGCQVDGADASLTILPPHGRTTEREAAAPECGLPVSSTANMAWRPCGRTILKSTVEYLKYVDWVEQVRSHPRRG